MRYDIFISYSRQDDKCGQVEALKAHIDSEFSDFAGSEIKIFFDKQEIYGMDDWRLKIQRSLRESRLFLAVLSPNYIASSYCRWEWEDYLRYEAMRQCLGEGIAPIFFVTLQDSKCFEGDPDLQRWIEEIHQRQAFDLCSWHEHGEQALKESHVRATLEQLHASIRGRLDRVALATRSPNNLIRHNAAFVGRVRELTSLRNALAQSKLGVVGVRQGKAIGTVTVQGLGGMGKTELALAYAHAFAWDYPGGRWQVSCDYISDLRLALTHLSGPMHFDFTEDEKSSIEKQFERVLREVDRRERCLLILDNVSDPHLFEPVYLDRLSRDGHIDLIATTRLSPTSIPGSAQDLIFIAVDELPEEDALALMRSHQPTGHFSSSEEEFEALRIVKLLRGFTLAVETAAIYLGRHSAPDACRQFRERLSPDLLHESEKAAADPAVAVRHRVRSLQETLAFTLATLTSEAMALLSYAALLPADQVVVPWLRSLAAERFPAFQDERAYTFSENLELLLGLRIFQPAKVVDKAGNLLVVRMHRLVQEFIISLCHIECRDNMEIQLRTYIHNRDIVLKRTKESPSIRWELAPLTALAFHWDGQNHPDAAWLMNQLSTYWITIAEWSEVEPLIRRALVIAENTPDNSYPIIATYLNNLAVLYTRTNRFEEAERTYRRVLTILETYFGKHHVKVASALNNLAVLLNETNRASESERYRRRAIKICRKCRDAEPSLLACLLSDIGASLRERNRYAEAEPLIRESLNIWNTCQGSYDDKITNTINNLALLFQYTNRHSEAEHEFRHALTIDEARYGSSHPSVARDLSNLSVLLQDLGRIEEAELLVRRALAIDEAVYGENHHDVAVRLHNLARLLQDTKRSDEAEPLFRRALAIYENNFGKDYPSVATELLAIGQVLMDLCKFDEAEVMMRKNLEFYHRYARINGHTHSKQNEAVAFYFLAASQLEPTEERIRATPTTIFPEIPSAVRKTENSQE